MLPVSGDGDACFVCGNSATKKCSRCKAVRYCSQSCQETDWKAGHKLKCTELKLYGNLDSKVSVNSVCGKSDSLCTRKSRTAILLDPVAGPCNTLQQPKVLFPYDEFVKLFNWDTTGFAPCGLLNCGNSCFANVVLQCLSCTRPLIAYLLERGHRRECRRNDWCFLCELQVHVERASRTLHPFSPINILSRLPIIGGNLGHGKQEDAHEFMRFAIDTMQTVCLDEFGGEKSLHPSSQETTLIQHIFGGYLQSQVICTKCNKISNRYESMMDLTVEIQGDAASLEDCLNQFTVQEWLDGENMYKCDGCNDYVKAWKRLTVHQAPNILTIALKRFQGGRFGKLNKRVTFPETLDLGPYMSKSDGNLYKLYAVVVHLDMLNASYFGHYICYTKDFDGNWYRIDDCKVVPVELEEVLAQGAYMLLYSRMYARPTCVNPFEPSKNEECQPLELTQQPCSQPVESLINGGCTPGCLPSGTSPQSHESNLERDFSSGFHSKSEIEDSHDMNMIDSGPTSSNLKVLEDSDSRFSHTADTDLPIEISSKECPDMVSSNNITSVEILKDEVPISYNDVASNFEHESEAMDEEQEMAVISPEVHVETLDSFVESLSDKHPTVPNTNLERAEMIPKLVKDNSSSVTKPKPLFRSGFLNKSSADKPLKKEGIALGEPCIEDTSCKMKSTCNGFSESGISRQNKNGSVNNGHMSPSYYMKNPCGKSIDELKMTNKEPNEVIYTHISDSNENLQKYKLFDSPQPLENASSDKERESEEPCETPHSPFKIEMNGKRLGDGSLVTSCEKGKNIKLH